MKVVVLNGSPKGKRSNTLKLTDAFVKGIQLQEEIELEVIEVNKQTIKPCVGCYGCWTKTPGKCVIDDDMNEIIPKILDANVVIWSFPLYYFSMPSGIKMLLDRMLPTNLPFMAEREDGGSAHPPRYPHMTQIRHILISTCGFHARENNYEALVKQFEICFGNTGNSAGLTKILCPEGELFRVPELSARTNEYLSYVQQAGSEYALSGVIMPNTQQKLDELLFPADVFIKMADASWEIETSPHNASYLGRKNDDAAKKDISLPFTKQMAALYNPNSWSKKDQVLEMHYTDSNSTYQIWLLQNESKVVEDSAQFLPYTARVETPLKVWQDIAAGTLDSMDALSEKKYKILGSLAFMSKWDDYFGGVGSSASAQVSEKKKVKKSNMCILLMPWLIVWIGIPIDPYWGSFSGIIGVGVIGLLSLLFQLTPYDKISIFCCGVISALGFIGVPVLWLSPAAYLAFGLLWFITVFLKIPLSAYYSCNGFGGLERAKGNHLFIKTNRILTACWGILYLLTPIWTWVLMQTEIIKYVSLINSALPAMLGLFTFWFQKWYPAKQAAGK